MSPCLSHVVPPQGRVAVVCLQRLGDLLSAAHVVDRLSRSGNVSRVELVHFDKTKAAAKLLPSLDCRHDLDFDRLKTLQKLHRLAPFSYLRQRIAEIRSEPGFDAVINLSSTPFSCAISAALASSKSKIFGPQIDQNRSFVASDPYCRFLNDWGTSPSLNMFAHQDLYSAAASIEPGPFLGKIDSLAAFFGADQLISASSLRPAPIAIHIFSSDPRKDWSSSISIQGWQGLIQSLRTQIRGEFWLFGAPEQQPKMQKIASRFGEKIRIFTCDLSTTANLIRQCTGLISVDTVAIHLANLVSCKSVVLQLGPAGGTAFLPGPGSVTVQSKRACSPCVGDRCNAESLHACHRDLFVSDLAAICEAHFFSKPLPLHLKSQLYQRLRVRQCYFDKNGLRSRKCPDWLSAPTHESWSDRNDDAWRTAWWTSWQAPYTVQEGLIKELFQVNDEVGLQRLKFGLQSPERLGQLMRKFAQSQQFRLAA